MNKCLSLITAIPSTKPLADGHLVWNRALPTTGTLPNKSLTSMEKLKSNGVRYWSALEIR